MPRTADAGQHTSQDRPLGLQKTMFLHIVKGDTAHSAGTTLSYGLGIGNRKGSNGASCSALMPMTHAFCPATIP